ncbi:XPG-I domain-containing protein [Plasmodiophora brassicae]|uniref:XPG-I domain-containing protein n=1 Tax=Plasmodiophora brassicae TaxID=37360 RepID=A0A0G4IPF8_PLABS|nr:hypothetical protein PBRA_005643 [Plasmodiophora brassicae]SPR01020.1 unnamed protein product [Plasmodiophora brassicae]
MGFNHAWRFLLRMSLERMSACRRPMRPMPVAEMTGRRVAVDANLYVHESMALRDDARTPPEVFRAWAQWFKQRNIEPIFVFDGMVRRQAAKELAPLVPDGQLQRRLRQGARMAASRQAAPPAGEAMERAAEWATLPEELEGVPRPPPEPTSGTFSSVKRALDNENVAWIRVKSDADSVLAMLAEQKIVDYVASEDADVLALGTPLMVRGLFHAFLYASILDHVEKVDLYQVLDMLEVTREQFVDVLLCLGARYDEGYIDTYIMLDVFMELLDNVRQGKFKHTEKAQQTRPYLIAPCTMDPVLLHPGTTKPMSLSEWAELLKVKLSYSRKDRTARGRRRRGRDGSTAAA